VITDHPGDRLSAYLDDELAAAERSTVEAHLQECAQCSRLLEDLAAVDSTAQSLTVQAPDGYFEAFPASVRQRLVARRRRRVPSWTWAAAAAAVLAVLTPLTLQHRAAPVASEARRDAAPAAPAPFTVVPPTTLDPAAVDRLRALGYNGPRPQLEARRQDSYRDFMGQPAGTVDGRLRERDAEGYLQRSAPGRGAAAELKKEAGSKDKLASNSTADAPGAVVGSVVGGTAPAAPEQQRQEPAAPGDQTLTALPPPPAAAEPEAKRAEAPALKASGARAAAKPAPQSAGADARTSSMDDAGVAEEVVVFADQPPRTADEARATARSFREYAQRHPAEPGADEARVRAIEALAAAWRLERKKADRDAARAQARAYLEAQGPQAERVRRIVQALER
jgi:hypothetical protein